jgi:hypothetical protein
MPRQAHPRSQLARLHTQYRDATGATRARTTSALSQLWLSLPNYRDDSIAAFADKGSRISAAGAIATATLTAAFVEIATRTISGDAQRPALDVARFADLRTGTTPLETYARPGLQVWYELSRGATITDAINRGLNRALTIASTDLQLAKLDAATQTLAAQPQITAYERVTGGNACPFCEEAAGTLYASDEVMELHDNCSCDVVPVFDGIQLGDATDFGASADTFDNTELGEVFTEAS